MTPHQAHVIGAIMLAVAFLVLVFPIPGWLVNHVVGVSIGLAIAFTISVINARRQRSWRPAAEGDPECNVRERPRCFDGDVL